MKALRRPIKLAVSVSLVLHTALGWWVLQGQGFGAGSQQRFAPAERRLSVRLLPKVVNPMEALESPLQAATPNLASQVKRAERPTERPSQGRRKAITGSNAAGDSAVMAPATDAPAESKAAVQQPALPVPLQLGLGRAVLHADRTRRQSPVANASDASQANLAEANRARAFAPLDAASSSIARETMLADGGRMLRFSGGGCMKMSNQAARSFDDTRRPTMSNC